MAATCGSRWLARLVTLARVTCHTGCGFASLRRTNGCEPPPAATGGNFLEAGTGVGGLVALAGGGPVVGRRLPVLGGVGVAGSAGSFGSGQQRVAGGVGQRLDL